MECYVGMCEGWVMYVLDVDRLMCFVVCEVCKMAQDVGMV